MERLGEEEKGGEEEEEEKVGEEVVARASSSWVFEKEEGVEGVVERLGDSVSLN